MNLNMIEALEDKNLLGQFLKDPKTWRSWFCFLRAFFGLPPADGDRELYKKCTGRSQWPRKPFEEGWVVAGRRSGKSFTIALIGAFLSAFREYPNLSVGERGHLIIVSVSKFQARIIKQYLSGFFNDNPFLNSLLVRDTRWEIDLSNGITIMVLSSDFRSLRGYTSVGCIIDELCFFFTEGSKPDYETIRALRPSLVTTKGPLLTISSPYAKQGVVYRAFRDHFGKDGSPALFWKAPSILMNPTLSQKRIDRAIQEDPEGGTAEWLAEFRSDIESFVSREVVESLVEPGLHEIPPIPDVHYQAFTDPAGGSGQDSFTLAIGHREDNRLILDCLRERKPRFSPDEVCREYSEILKAYKVRNVVGDRYAGEFPRERFHMHGIRYEVAEKPKSDLYRDMLPLLNSGEITLLDHKRLIEQLVNLERRTGRGARDSIDHPPHGHDDLANSLAGLCSLLDKRKNKIISGAKIFLGPSSPITSFDEIVKKGGRL